MAKEQEAAVAREPLWIVVDAGESRSGLPELLKASWAHVEVRRLSAGDVAVGRRVLVERKTVEDLIASMDDGRLFGQARRISTAATRPILIQEGNPGVLAQRVDSGAYRGALLALSVGFRIPVLMTRDVGETAVVIRHIAAQEAKRASRRRLMEERKGNRKTSEPRAQALSQEALDVLCALPGVGRARAEAIAAHVSSLSDLAQLGVRDLMALPGIGPDTAAGIVDTLRARGTSTTQNTQSRIRSDTSRRQ